MKIKSLIKHNLMRAAMTLALILACATAWAGTVETYYIDENGTRHDVTATVVTTNMESLGTDGETTWYVVNENVFLYDGSNNQTHLHGNVNLIIADGCELKPACGSNGPNDGFRGSGNLTLYGQTASTGTLSCGQEGFMNITGDFTVCSGMVSVSGNFYNAIRAANFTMRGGSVSITNNTNNDCGIRATGTVNIYSGSVVAAGSIGIAAGTVNIYGGSVTARCNGRNAPESNYGYAIQCSSTFNFYGGNVTVQGDYNWHEGQTRYGIHANSINLSWTSTDDWIYNTKDDNSDNVICYFVGSGGMNIAPYKPFTDGTTTYTGTLTDEQVEALADKTLQPVVPAFAETGDGTPEYPYTIYNTAGWGEFCDALQDATYNHFSGKTVKLGANISITQSAGSAGHEFMGTFNGDGKTLTVDITETTTQGTAPFREIKGATIQNLVVTGSVDGTIHAAGLVGFARGADANTVNTITNCKVATNVTVTTPNSAGNYHCGGVVGHALQCTLNMSNTVYCGDITSSGNNYVGGLQGWSDGNTINFSHCLFAGSYNGTASFHPVAVRNKDKTTTADVSHVYYTATPTLTNSSFIAADGTKTTGRTTAPDNLGSQATYSFMDMTVYENGLYYNGLYYVAPTLNTDNSGAYLISSVDDWTNFCDMLYDNGTYNRFSGQTVKLGADIEVSRMAGANSHDFCGTFDGQNNTLTATATATDNYLAPFRYVSGTSETNHAVIQNLDVVTNITATDFRHAAGLIADMSGYVDVTNCNVTANITANKGTNQTQLYPAGLVSQVANGSQLTVSGCTVSGTISTDGKYAGGMVGIVQGSANITNSVSSVTINSSTDGDGTHGGFVASLVSGRQLTIEGCVFNGKIVTTNGTTNCGGFLGHNNTDGGTGATITNCLYAPTADPNTMSTGCATFGRNVNSDLINNCYYTTDFNDGVHFIGQGKQARSITAGDYVTVENAGTATTYSTSGITSYGTGILYDNVLYAGNGDEVSLTLAHQDREGYDFIGYTATAGNLNGSTLTMPDGNVTINAEYTCTAPSELTATDITFTTATLNWNGFQESYNVRYRTDGANEWQTIDNIAATTTMLSGLLSGTTYEWQVQGLDCDGNGGTTEWSAATFTTLSTCEVQPSELTATDITATTATLNWNGSQESYNVRYQPVVILNEGFESGTMPDGWTRTGSYWQVTSGTGNDDYTGAATGNFNAGCYINSYNSFDILITPVMDLGNVASATLSFNFWNTVDEYGGINILKVHYRVDEGEWHLLYTYGNATDRWIPVTINLEGMAAHYQIGFECESHGSYGMGIDDVKVTRINTSEWTTVTNVSSPHNLTGLMPETPYVWQVQGSNCDGEGSTTEWSEVGTFTTLSPCEVAPSGLTATSTATTATLNWNGFQESYSVRYLPFILYEGFESGTMPDGWTRTGAYGWSWEVTSGTGFYNHTGAATGNYNAGCCFSTYGGSGILITPVMDLGNVASAALSFNFWNTDWDGNINILKVYYRVDEGEWHLLNTYGNATDRWIPVTIILEGLAANYQIGFECESHGSYGMGIDDVKVTGIYTSEWTTVTNVSSPHNLTGLTPETQYLWQVQGLDCDGEGSTTEWSEMGIFTTLAGIDLTVAGYEEGNGGWVFIASPVAGSIAPSEVHNLFPSAGETSNDYDLYRFDQSSTNGKEWQNWKQDEGHNNVAPGFSLVNGQGYLYASKETRTLVFAGEYTAATGSVEVPLDYDATAQLKGWN